MCLFAGIGVFAQTTPPIVPSQTEQIYLISSQAGGVSQVEGDVNVKRADSQSAQALAKGDTLRERDRVLTGADGRAEILLNPGSYLRVGDHAEVELTGTALDALKIQITKGSVIVEANTIGGKNGASISIATGQAVVQLEKAGLYRINATGDVTEVLVWEGSARVGSQIVKSGRRLTIGASISIAVVTRFDRSSLDSFDLWSAGRADELAKLNDRLRRTDLQTALASNSWNYDSYFSNGYWVFDRRTRTWCYVPYYGSRHSCCRAYGQHHSTAVSVKKGDPVVNIKKGDPIVSVVYKPGKSDVSAVDVISKRDSGGSSGSSSGSSDSGYSSPPSSKSDSNSSPSKSDSSPPPTKSDPPSSPPPSKNDNSPPPSKKDGLK